MCLSLYILTNNGQVTECNAMRNHHRALHQGTDKPPTFDPQNTEHVEYERAYIYKDTNTMASGSVIVDFTSTNISPLYSRSIKVRLWGAVIINPYTMTKSMMPAMMLHSVIILDMPVAKKVVKRPWMKIKKTMTMPTHFQSLSVSLLC